MSTPTNHWKLGLFVVLGVVITIGAFVFFGGRALQRETVSYKTYFDESVQGLETGSPVKFRGVTIGSVTSIDVAADRRHVEVTYELGVKVLDALGLAVEKHLGQTRRLFIPPDLRAQLAASGITGVKFIQMDFFDQKTNPPPKLPFDVPENFIPSAGSVLKGLEDSVVRVVDGFPEMMKRLLAVVERIDTILLELDGQHLPQKVAHSLALLDETLTTVNQAIVAIAPGAISKDTRAALANIGVAVERLNVVLAQLGGEKGLTASLQRTSDSLGAMAENATQTGPAVEDVARDVQRAARAIQRLADALDADPDMLIKGRGKRADR